MGDRDGATTAEELCRPSLNVRMPASCPQGFKGCLEIAINLSVILVTCTRLARLPAPSPHHTTRCDATKRSPAGSGPAGLGTRRAVLEGSVCQPQKTCPGDGCALLLA